MSGLGENRHRAQDSGPLVTPALARHLARYNLWQNDQLYGVLNEMNFADAGAAYRDFGAFWGTIHGTLAHLLWADWVWMARFENKPGTSVALADSAGVVGDVSEWAEARVETDRRILQWADGLDKAALARDLRWFSGAAGRALSRRTDLLVAHFFNHQTHHRGQVHAMLSQAGIRAPVSDMVFVPEIDPEP
jgi:uncharacterized damage-inducible protein DinB